MPTEQQKDRFSDWKSMMVLLIRLLGGDFALEGRAPNEALVASQFALAFARLPRVEGKNKKRQDSWTVCQSLKEYRPRLSNKRNKRRRGNDGAAIPTGEGDQDDDQQPDAMDIDV
jgi:hypothetical protein